MEQAIPMDQMHVWSSMIVYCMFEQDMLWARECGILNLRYSIWFYKVHCPVCRCHMKSIKDQRSDSDKVADNKIVPNHPTWTKITITLEQF